MNELIERKRKENNNIPPERHSPLLKMLFRVDWDELKCYLIVVIYRMVILRYMINLG